MELVSDGYVKCSPEQELLPQQVQKPSINPLPGCYLAAFTMHLEIYLVEILFSLLLGWYCHQRYFLANTQIVRGKPAHHLS